ncbi:16S rRNA pseudouridine(516) synthase [Marinagarivorans algicola]|uniref:16S rRNA pseudouridine(516) synthase n=1 Tax=Marinagarivorans algicola TaxID=1513270 RepID=UPI001FD3A027|nr:16S rRNA pseudouridine(516) synthase [Marinagarivorans algicola]
MAASSGLSRKQATLEVRRGNVQIDGIQCKRTATQLSDAQQNGGVTLNSTALFTAKPLYLMLHKPKGYVCANTDADHPTVFDLLNERDFHPSLQGQLQVAGRLDIDTTGLVLITSDGLWNHTVTSPNKKLGKRYLVTTANPIASDSVALFEQGLELRGDSKLTKPAKLIITGSHCAELEITEGRYHQVKRMFAAVGNKVVELHRVRIADITLDDNLAPCEYRTLTAEEVNGF